MEDDSLFVENVLLVLNRNTELLRFVKTTFDSEVASLRRIRKKNFVILNSLLKRKLLLVAILEGNVWQVMSTRYMKKLPPTQEFLNECVNEFERLGFPQCLGAIDGCHIEIKPNQNDATDYYNYKGWYSMVLLALVDYRYRFLYINIGAPGRCNDSKIYNSSLLKKVLGDCDVLKDCKCTRYILLCTHYVF